MSTIWFVISVANAAAFKAVYLGADVRGVDAPNEAEAVGEMLLSRDGTKLMIGSSRITGAAADALVAANPPWLDKRTSFPDDIEWGTVE